MCVTAIDGSYHLCADQENILFKEVNRTASAAAVARLRIPRLNWWRVCKNWNKCRAPPLVLIPTRISQADDPRHCTTEAKGWGALPDFRKQMALTLITTSEVIILPLWRAALPVMKPSTYLFLLYVAPKHTSVSGLVFRCLAPCIGRYICAHWVAASPGADA